MNFTYAYEDGTVAYLNCKWNLFGDLLYAEQLTTSLVALYDLYTRLRNSDQLTDALNWWCGWTRWLLLPHLSDRYLPPLPPQPPCCCKNQLGMANICWPRASDLDDRRVTIAVVQMLQPVFSTENDQWTLANVLVLRTVSNKLVAAMITRRKVHGCDMKLSQTNVTINETFPLIPTTICVE